MGILDSKWFLRAVVVWFALTVGLTITAVITNNMWYFDATQYMLLGVFLLGGAYALIAGTAWYMRLIRRNSKEYLQRDPRDTMVTWILMSIVVAMFVSMASLVWAIAVFATLVLIIPLTLLRNNIIEEFHEHQSGATVTPINASVPRE